MKLKLNLRSAALMKESILLIATMVITVVPAYALTREQAIAGGIVAGGMCAEYKGLLSEKEAKEMIKLAMAEEGMDPATMVQQSEVMKFAYKMFNIIKKEEDCAFDL